MATAPLSRAASKALTRERILAAARTVFERRGFHAASLDQVAREAGFTKGAVYSAFDSKADLFLTLLAERAGERRAALAAITGEGYSGEALVAEISRRFARSVGEEHDWWAAVIEFATFAARDEKLRARYAEHHDASREAVARVIEADAAASGRMLTEDPRALATATLALGNGLTLEALLSPAEVPETLYASAQAALYRGATTSTQDPPR